jgi:hypothetical protein
VRERLSRTLDNVSEFLAARKGLLPLIGILMVIVNFILQLTTIGWLTQTDFFLHFGVILAVIGILLAWAL